jgi:thiamine-phosphate pyrophosphorylase
MHAAATDAAVLRGARARRLRGLYALTPDTTDTDALVARVAAALEGGATAIQYRSKHPDAALRATQARALARVLAVRGGAYIVNDDAVLAREVGADGVHLGEDDGSIAAAREILGPDRLVGVSCYDDFDRAQAAVADGADYVAFGSFFPSGTKPKARRADVALLTRAQSLGVPVVAIGGITSDNAESLFAAGADAVAVIQDVFGHDDVEAVRNAADAMARAFHRATRANG